MVRPTAGRVLVEGRPLAFARPADSLRAGIASVPQELTVAPTMTVAENVMLGHEPRRPPGLLRPRELRRRAEVVLDSLSLEIPTNAPVGPRALIQHRV